MAGVKISELALKSVPLDNDLLPIVDNDGTPTTKRTTLGGIMNRVSDAVLALSGRSKVVTIGTESDPFLGGTLTLDASAGAIFDIVPDGATLIDNPINAVNGQTIRLRVTMNTGDVIITLGDQFVIPEGATSPLPWSTETGKMDMLAATYHATRDKWDIVAFVPGY